MFDLALTNARNKCGKIVYLRDVRRDGRRIHKRRHIGVLNGRRNGQKTPVPILKIIGKYEYKFTLESRFSSL
jgi:hypothetical protein